ncbi:MAG: asparagine synthase (glutamine-hydrolyzing) [Verrucomicrobiales bacterium]|nr:asparagine synthase (glutamine-hydrolyzing) [Verrucomicrobiales bacterium]
MCGIFGWITPGRALDRVRGIKATNLMRHRGPDDEGYLLCDLARGTAALAGGAETSGALRLSPCGDPALLPGADAMFGFRRLAIHDLTEAGHQPMGTPDGKLWIVFNGEVYNFPELRTDLEQNGVPFRSRTDTEVILRAYEAWGAACLQRFNGMWGLAILDLRKVGQPRLFLARDRCGVKPLYYAEDDQGGVAFASELKALLPLREARWKLDAVANANFLAWGRTPSARAGDTFFQDIRMVPPGCCAEWTGRTLEFQRWWDLQPDGDGTQCGADEAVAKLRTIFDDAVKLRLRADVPVGSCLSGGLDSSAIVGQVSRLLRAGQGSTNTGGTQHTFSAVYRLDGPFNEKRFIDRVLEGIPATAHFAWPDGETLAADFEKLVWHQEEPFTTTSIFAQWCVMKKVREQNVTVLLDGQAADELFAGYRPYRWWFREMVRRGKLAAAVREARAVARETGDIPWKHLLRGGAMAALPDGMVRSITRMGYRRALNRASTILRPDKSRAVLERVNDSASLESYPWRRVVDPVDAHLRGLMLDFGLPRLLHFEDRNSMAFSVESRVPFTDYRLVEFAFSPALRELKLKDGWAKWCLRKAVHGLVPEDIVWRRDKMGFGTPEPVLVRHLLAAGHGSASAGEVASEYLDPVMVRRTMHAASLDGASKEVILRAFRCLVFQAWTQQFPNAI